jgi:hypothetical protein
VGVLFISYASPHDKVTSTEEVDIALQKYAAVLEKIALNAKKLADELTTTSFMLFINFLDHLITKNDKRGINPMINKPATITACAGIAGAILIFESIAQSALHMVTRIHNHDSISPEEIFALQKTISKKQSIFQELRAYFFPTAQEIDLKKRNILTAQVSNALMSAKRSFRECLLECTSGTEFNSEGIPTACEYAADALKALGQQNIIDDLLKLRYS